MVGRQGGGREGGREGVGVSQSLGGRQAGRKGKEKSCAGEYQRRAGGQTELRREVGGLFEENNPSRGRKNFNAEGEAAAAVGKGGWTGRRGRDINLARKIPRTSSGVRGSDSERRARPDNSMADLVRGEEIC